MPPLKRRYHHHGSLIKELSDWTLVPLILLWPVSVILIFFFAGHIASAQCDEILKSDIRLLKEDLYSLFGDYSTGEVEKLIERTRSKDTVTRFQIATEDGQFLWADSSIPFPERSFVGYFSDNDIKLRNAIVLGTNERIASTVLDLHGQNFLIQLIGNQEKKNNLMKSIIFGMLFPQMIIPIAILLAYLGLHRGINSFTRLQKQVQEQDLANLMPFNLSEFPKELHTVIKSFNLMMEKLERGMRLQKSFITDAAHELKSPLTALNIQIELAKKEKDLERQQIHLSKIHSIVGHSINLVNQMVNLARVKSAEARSIFQTYPVDINELAREVTSQCVPYALKSGIDLGFEGSSQSLICPCEKTLLGQLLHNLIDNAIKYTQRGGYITVRVYMGLNIICEVEDNGIGIPEGQRNKIFEPFHRIKESKVQGSGLGLCIVKEIADLHGIDIALVSPKNQRGSLFRITFNYPKNHSTNIL